MSSDISTIGSSNVFVNFNAPTFTDVFNKKLSFIIPAGVYRGFTIETTITALTVRIKTDSFIGDSVAAVVTPTGHLLTTRLQGDVDLALTSFASTTIFIVLEGDYQIGTPTFIKFRAYSVVEYEALPQEDKETLVVLGQVIVPAAGTIPAGNISATNRNFAWQRRIDNSFIPLIQNSSFEDGTTTGTTNCLFPWTSTFSSGNAVYRKTSAHSIDGLFGCELFSTTTTAISSTFRQLFHYPASQFNKVLFSLKKKALKIVTSSATSLQVYMKTVTSAGSTNTYTNNIPATSVDSDFITVEGTFSLAPTDVLITEFGIQTTALTTSTAGSIIVFDSVQLFVDNIDAFKNSTLVQKKSANHSFSQIAVEDPTTNVSTDDGSAITYETAGNAVKIQRKDKSTVSSQVTVQVPGAMQIGSNNLDTLAKSLLPRLDIPFTATSSTFTHIEQLFLTGQHGARHYAQANGDSIYIINASWNGTVWTADKTTESAVKITFSITGMKMQFKAVTTVSWNDASWDVIPFEVQNTGTVTINNSLAIATNKFTVDNLGNTVSKRTLALGDDLTSTAANAEIAKLAAKYVITGVGERTLIFESAPASGATKRARIYISKIGNIEFTLNARWTETTLRWNADDSTSSASYRTLTQNSDTLRSKATTITAWIDSVDPTGWDKDVVSSVFSTNVNSFAGSLAVASALAGNSDTSRLRTPVIYAANNKALSLSDEGSTGKTGLSRVYFNQGSSTELTTNARYTNGTNQWSSDSSVVKSSMIRLTPDVMVLGFNSNNASPFADSAWTTDPLSKRLTFDLQDTPTNIAHTMSIYSYLAASGNFTLLAGVPTIHDSFNVATVVPSATDITITFSTAFATTNITILPLFGSVANICYSEKSRTTTTVVYEGRTAHTNVVFNFSAASGHFSFAIIGRQP